MLSLTGLDHDTGGLSGIPTGVPFTLQDPFTLGLDPVSKYYVDYCEYISSLGISLDLLTV